MKLELELSNDDLGYSASISFMSVGQIRTSLTFGEKDAISAVNAALKIILAIAPDLTQEELDKNYEAFFSSYRTL